MGRQVCAIINACLIPFFEGTAPFHEVFDKVGLPFLVVNASTAFLLNVAVVFLIGAASSLVLTLSVSFRQFHEPSHALTTREL